MSEMDDIANRLRWGADCPVSSPGGDIAKEMLEGAQEILTLRAELRSVRELYAKEIMAAHEREKALQERIMRLCLGDEWDGGIEP